VFDGFGGFAAFRAESLWLSVCALKLPAATPREAKPRFVGLAGRKVGGIPHGGRQSRL